MPLPLGFNGSVRASSPLCALCGEPRVQNAGVFPGVPEIEGR